ncbi:PhoH-like ATPase [Novimethylophilus kurashikiensis]|uniref:PhoH-like ATPase n=1 Tax=Novimethylophilus kurashikiensis TaxID=1825523 RepID=A0A2R5F9Y4_9PROT|nr:PhoH family protein [Novimethylophilus kurashikiensis]GBG14358.1 PhoH-like ATPase [Novimethylophilus kurashikiensis]
MATPDSQSTSKAARSTVKTPKPRKTSAAPAPVPQKQYVLDTNVLLHDPTSLYRFEEHDVYIPLVVLEELDRHKKGTADIARNARQVTRQLDTILLDGSMEEGFSLSGASNGVATGRLYFRSAEDCETADKLPALEQDKADNQILACAMCLLKTHGNTVLVTKDINLRVKALACDIPAQDYRSDKVLSDEDVLPPGFMRVDEDFWTTYQDTDATFWRRDGRQYTTINIKLPVNSFLTEDLGKGRTRIWRVESHTAHESIVYSTLGPLDDRDTMVTARNDEQVMALNLLRDMDVDCVALLGQAGTGKTLLALAAGMEQVKQGKYQGVLVTRATVPMGEDIGYVPGTEEEKMNAWLGGSLRDTFTALGISTDPRQNKHGVPPAALVEMASMSFMRGRSFQGKYIIIDEAQNLTVRQMRALLTRVGEGTKVVLAGNLSQVDSPYLDEGSSGLAWAVKCLQDWEHAGHLILSQGERSRLATFIEEVADRNDQH